jgi:hypothetical protein
VHGGNDIADEYHVIRHVMNPEPIFAEQPNHPGVAHYLIHSDDAASLAEAGLPAALAPSSLPIGRCQPVGKAACSFMLSPG